MSPKAATSACRNASTSPYLSVARRDSNRSSRTQNEGWYVLQKEAAELCQAIAVEAQPLLEHGHPPALPDGQVGIQLLDACRRAQSSLVRTNLTAPAGLALIETVRPRLEQLNTDAIS